MIFVHNIRQPFMTTRQQIPLNNFLQIPQLITRLKLANEFVRICLRSFGFVRIHSSSFQFIRVCSSLIVNLVRRYCCIFSFINFFKIIYLRLFTKNIYFFNIIVRLHKLKEILISIYKVIQLMKISFSINIFKKYTQNKHY